ncbi:MAG: PH domain-containing protein [Betaproteobacteria bacterium]|nr:PH domain-containing protein [Betaproteobacteria bacterium]MDE2358356.1 PH domain-containing protein [Betaproteobacteria bacterium]
MSYIDGNLLGGERVVFRTRLHWKLLVGPLLFAAVTVLAIPLLVSQGIWHNLVLIAPGAGLLAVLVAIIRRQSSDFAVTNKRVMMKVGVFSTRSVEILLSKIEAIAVHQSLLGRMLDYGDIVVTGTGGTEEAFSSIQAPMQLRRAVQSVTDGQSDAVKA